MDLVIEYEKATRDAELARLHRVLAVRAMLAEGASQREVAQRLGLSQPAISYQVARARTDGIRPSVLLEAGGSLLRRIAEDRGFAELAAFGSAARGDDRPDSDVDLLVLAPAEADAFDLLHLEEALSNILGRVVDLVSSRGLNARLDRDILRDKVPL